MRKIEFENVQEFLVKQLKAGIFMNTKTEDKLNTMTIAWGLSGRIWNKDCFSVAVRYSRYTYEMIEKSEYFTISVPALGTMKEELALCGTVSGRDRDKFAEANLTPLYLDESPVPSIAECDLHILCKIAYKQTMEPSLIQADYVKNNYSNYNYHAIYYGEIIGVYVND